MRTTLKLLSIATIGVGLGVVVLAVLIDQGIAFGPRPVSYSEVWSHSPTTDYCTIGPHRASFSKAFYIYREGNKGKVLCAYYPIRPTPSEAAAGGQGADPIDENCYVFVKTNRFSSRSEIRAERSKRDSVAGRVVGNRRTISPHVLDILNRDFPGLQTSKIIVFEEGPWWGLMPLWPFALILGLALAYGGACLAPKADEVEASTEAVADGIAGRTQLRSAGQSSD